jgi:5S rRNA maturation endonuclease (ribonuclease M5)
MKKFTDQEVKAFMSRTNEELIIQDPLPLLQDLGIEYKEMGNDSYKMNLRNEKTASAYITLKDGAWKYKDFGSGTNGNIINVVMDATGKGFKQALNYSLQTLGVKNYLEEALNSKTQSYELSQADRERIRTKREQNRTKERSHVISRVTAIYEVSSNQLAVDYLKARGIIKIPPHMKIINGEYENKHGELKKAFGVGVLTRDGKGADIHFLKTIGDLKTMSFGEKDISFFKNPNSQKVAIFESKMDYAAAYQQMPLDDVNVVIANSSSNSIKIAELLKKEDLNKNVMIFNQNDYAGYKLVVDVVKNADIQEFKSIGYQVMTEYKKDVNDLLLGGEVIADRIETRPLEYFETIANSLEAIQKQQQQKTVIVKQEDLKKANESAQVKDNEHTRG